MRTTDPVRVLLIDDDELSRAVLQLHLSATGYAVTQAESGDAAMQLLRDGAGSGFDVVLSDLQMPGLQGPALARAIREVAEAQMPLLAMSGSEPAPERYAGFDRFLQKPFTLEEFDAALRGVQQDAQSAGNQGAKAAAEVLEEATFAKLQSMMQPPQLSELFILALAELDKQLVRMQQAMGQSDAAALKESAHTMKGGFSILGALEMRDLGARLEAGTGTPADQAATLREIPLAAERLRRMLTSRGLRVSSTRSSGQETR